MNILQETVDDFYDRSYWNYPKEKVLVWPAVRGKCKCEIWLLEQAKDYLKYLENHNKKVVV